MTEVDIYQWLIYNGDHVIRYRTVTELIPVTSEFLYNVDDALQKILAMPVTQKWLALTTKKTPGSPFGIHGSKRFLFENFLPKMNQLGIKAGSKLLDDWAKPFIDLLDELRQRSELLTKFNEFIISSFLLQANYSDPILKTSITDRLNTIFDFIKLKDYNIYIDPSLYPAMPKTFQDRPLVNPRLNKNNELLLPTIYDLYGLAALEDCTLDLEICSKIDAVIDYILDPSYQTLYPGYGILYWSNGNYYSMSYSLHLIGYFDEPNITSIKKPREQQQFLRQLLLLSKFPRARKHPWFQKSMDYLETFKTRRDTYLFPKEFLQEKSSGYWIHGSYMGLNENRRKRLWQELESTFWMMKLKKLLGLVS